MKPSPYGPFPYSPIVQRPRLEWPNGARIALWLIPNIEFFSLAEKVPAGSGGSGIKPPDVPAWSVRDYGNRIGLFRLMEVMDRYSIRGTVALNSEVCLQHPFIIEACMARNWELMGHNETNTRRLNEVPPEEERKIIRNAFATIERASGTRPRGWLSSGLQETWESVDILAQEGCQYVCDWTNDDQPYVMTLDEGRRLLSVPYSYDINDKPVFESKHYMPADFTEMICRQFDVLYNEGAESGRVMAIALHPYIIGMPYRIGALDKALEYICGHADVWLTTGGGITDHYLKQRP
ncbi:MAG: polysaccharide deacetylase family protein [Burkholderiales bacterium]